jgi:GT2 family glycosyltransferase
LQQLAVPGAPAGERPGLSRNSPCDCGSGQRYKACCGASSVAAPLTALAESSKNAGLAAQQRSEFAESVAHYDVALRLQPLDFDAAHMRAVALYQMGCMPESLDAFLDILAAGHPMSAAAWHNFGLTVASTVQLADDPLLLRKALDYQQWTAERRRAAVEPAPTVTVVLASYNHARFISEAIQSVLNQTRLPDQLIVIDDGSIDESAARIRDALVDAPFPTTVIVRENRGAATTFNEAIALATSDWIAPLNSDDRFAPDRIERLVEACCRGGIDWGFGRVNVLDAAGNLSDAAPETRAHALRGISNTGYMSATTGLSFLLANPAISTGNLFFRKSLWQRVGKFRDWRYHHDWDFALQASLHAEPLRVALAVYEYRMHESNTITENRDAVKAECSEMMREVLSKCAAFDATASDNSFAPCPAIWRRAFFSIIGGVGFLEQLPVQALNSFATELLEAPRPC